MSEDGLECKVKQVITSTAILEWLGDFNIDLAEVGVYKYSMLDNQLTTLPTKSLHGKALRVLNYIVSIPLNVLLEAM